MSNNLTANNPTSYLGVKATKPPQMIIMQRAPTQNDVIGYVLGTQWLQYDPDNPTEAVQYVLSSIEQRVATWVPLNQGGDSPTLPDHSVALGTGVPGFNSASTVATIGMALVSTGATSDPEFGIVTVSGGGTGLNDCDPYAVYCGGTTGEGPLQQVSGLGSAGEVLTSQGNGNLPIWSAAGAGGAGGPIAVQVFTSDDTYTPTAGMGSCIVECVGAGGGGGSITTAIGGAGGGGAGGYTRKFYLAADIGASQPIVVGTGGAATVTGEDTTFGTGGTLITANGGVGGGSGINGIGGLGGAASGGDVNTKGGAGGSGCAPVDAADAPTGLSGFGGSGIYGSGGLGYPNAATDSVGQVGNLYGGGGSGAVRQTSGSSAGGAGANGIVIVTEYGPYGVLPPIAATTVNVIVYDTPGAGTYTPTANMNQVIVEVVGGGGGGAAAFNSFGATTQVSGAGGGGGAYSKKLYSSADIGASKPYVVGAGGTAGVTGNPPTAGGAGGNTTFGTGGTLITAGGGFGSATSAGGTASGGNINVPGWQGGQDMSGVSRGSVSIGMPSSPGGNSLFGSGGISVGRNTITTAGQAGTGYGAGGSGAYNSQGQGGSVNGGAGSSGVVIITEYIS